MNQLACVIVTYNPDLSYFSKVIGKILENETTVIVVDNGSENVSALESMIPISVGFMPLSCNVGIARAQNIGIEAAFEDGCDYIWLSDQDTIYPDDFASNMMAVVDDLEHQNIRFGALGPSFFELNRQRIEAFVHFVPWSKRFQPRPGLNKVAHLIASGMIISKAVFESVGGKREDFFIDWVDLEWCWRANKLGYQVYGTGDVVIEHNLGDLMVELGNKKISIRSPFRHYFIIRNGLYLCLHDDLLPFAVRLHYIIRTLMLAISYPILSPTEKWKHLKANALGLWHGIIGKLGPKP